MDAGKKKMKENIAEHGQPRWWLQEHSMSYHLRDARHCCRQDGPICMISHRQPTQHHLRQLVGAKDPMARASSCARGCTGRCSASLNAPRALPRPDAGVCDACSNAGCHACTQPSHLALICCGWSFWCVTCVVCLPLWK